MDKSPKTNQNTPDYLKRKDSPASINLIPDLTKREKTKIQSKETVNFSSAIFIFMIMLFTLGLLFTNFYLRLQKNTLQGNIKGETTKIASLKSTELKLKNAVNKYNAIHELKKDDLQYFYFTEEANNFPAEIYLKTIALTESKNFTIAGLAMTADDFDSFVALLEQHDDFSDVNITNMTILSEEQRELAEQYKEDQYTVSWEIEGKFFKEVSRGEVIDKLDDL